MLTSVRLVQWRAHEDTTVPLDARFTALVGANGTGKTSVLDAVFRVGLALLGSTALFDGAKSLALTKRRGSPDDSTFVSVTGQTTTPWEVWLRISNETDGQPLAQVEVGTTKEARANASFRWTPVSATRAAVLGDAPDGPSSLQSSVLYRLSTERIAAGDEVTERRAHIASDGSGLTALLVEWKLNDPERYQAWAADVRSVLPRFRGVRFTRSAKEHGEHSVGQPGFRQAVRTLQQQLLIDFDDEREISSLVVSEGTLLVMTLLAALHQDPLPRVVLLDDIDRGLHPHAQQELVSMVMKILARKPQTQFVVTTHSPFVVDMLQPEQVVALARNSAGRVVAKRMSEHPKRHLLKQLSMGEFWSAEDEAWVVAEPAIAPETSEPRSHG